MSGRFGVMASLALVVVGGLAVGLIPSAHGAVSSGGRVVPLASSGPGDFIVRCFYNGNAVSEDPIDKPGSSSTDHLHIFFGNMASGAAAQDGTTFPNIQSGDYSTTSDTMESNGLATPTNCQDKNDTAGYWVPEPYQVTPSGSPTVLSTLGNGCSTGCTAGGNNPDFYQRDYYIPHGSTANQEIPNGAIMIAGYPLGCTTVSGITPTGCSSTGSPSYPVDVGVTGVPHIVEYECGADTSNGLFTPASAWPYNCTKYTDADDSFSDGVVAIVNFPDCWNGNSDWTPPNGDQNSPKVAGYVAPWIPDPSAPTSNGIRLNDFAYPPNGGVDCTDPNFPHPVAQLSERTHMLVNGADWGAPSTCKDDTGDGWNSSNNAENSTVQSLPSNNYADDDSDGDATIQVNSNPSLYGFQHCVTAGSPAPGNVSTLSFACTHSSMQGQSDPNCNIALNAPKTCASGTCYVGAYEYGWETLHADYWQTWQEGSSSNASDAGTFQDLIDDCTNGTNGACSFINSANSTPALQVYGPPPP